MKNIKNYKITVFGDSIPKGIVIKDNRPTTIDNSVVKAIENHYGISINNISKFGQTLAKLHERNVFDTFLEKIGDEDNHIAVFFIGGNDCDYNWKAVALEPTAHHEPKTPLSQFEQMLHSNVAKMKTKCKSVVLVSIPPLNSAKFFHNYIGGMCDNSGVLHFMHGDIYGISRHQECYNIAIMKTAKALDVPFIDIRTDFLRRVDCADYICVDGIHPNEQGHALMANSIIAQLDNVLLAD